MKHRQSLTRTLLWASCLILIAHGCGEAESSDDSGGTGIELDSEIDTGDSVSTPAQDSTSQEGDDADAGNGATAGCYEENPLNNDDFWVVYTLRGRVPGVNLDESEIYIMNSQGGNPLNPDDPDPLSITEFSLQGDSHQWCAESKPWPLSCEKGCTLDDSLQWIAVGLPVPAVDDYTVGSSSYNPNLACLSEAENPPDPSQGFSVWLGQLDATLKAKMVKGAVLQNLAHFEFKNNKMFYSKKATCIGPSCTYDIFMRDLSVNVNDEIKLLEFPPQDYLSNSVYKGYFHLSSDGEMLGLLNPTIRSQSYWTWSKGNLHLLKLLCQAQQNDKCIGTGSHYSDRDPVAISPEENHETLVTMTISESNQRAWKYRTNADQEPLWSNIVSTSPGTDYWTSVCGQMSEPWHYAFTEGHQFVPEGESVVYLGRSECNGIGLKSETDILEIPLALIGNGKPVQEGDIFNITQNPKTTTADNIVFGTFDLCGNGQAIAASGTPSVDLSGNPLDDDNQATKSDRELYLFSRDGCDRKQMTKDVMYEVTKVQCVPNKYDE